MDNQSSEIKATADQQETIQLDNGMDDFVDPSNLLANVLASVDSSELKHILSGFDTSYSNYLQYYQMSQPMDDHREYEAESYINNYRTEMVTYFKQRKAHKQYLQ